MSSEVVIDASLAIKWVVKEVHSTEAMALLRTWEQRQVSRVVPSWFACEVANGLYKRVLRSGLLLGRAQANLEGILNEVVVRDFEPALSKRALELALRFKRPASYDAHYLALAEHLGREFWTADAKLWNATHTAHDTLAWVRWIEEVASP